MSGPRVTLVTGAASGMGRAVAQLLRGRGERVIGLDLREGEVLADLSTAAGRQAALAEIASLAPDGLDAMVACAGLVHAPGPSIVSVNYFGVAELAAGLLPLLQRGRDPRVAVISSAALMFEPDPKAVEACLAGDEALARELCPAMEIAYPASKNAIARWIRRTSISPGWADKGVLLNGIAPGVVRTAMTAPILANPEAAAMVRQSTPYVTADIAEAEDIAPLLAFLVSADNRFMVGQVIFCDGGSDVILRGDGAR